ncbi:MAG: hypothetical protein NT093_00115, partial [Candidatus Moranbacteria bacterium]|nr:hypothetical protein [Candidatus Moranbacteria bacterium]
MEMQSILKRRLKAKGILVIVGVVILIFVALSFRGNSNHQPKSVRGNNLPTEQPKKQEQATAIKTDSQPAVEASANVAKSNQQNQSANPTKTLSEEDQIKQLVSKQLKSTTSGGKERIRKIEVIEQYDGGWGVFTEYNADDVMTANLTKKSIELDMTDLYKT